MKILPHIFLALFFFGLFGCATLMKEPRVAIQKTSITGVDSSGLEVEFQVRVENPNTFDLTLMGYSYDLQLMAVPFSSGRHQGEVSFPAGQATDLRLPVRIKFADLIDISKRIMEVDRIPYHLTASLSIKTPLGDMAVPVDKSDVFHVPDVYRSSNFLRRLMQPLKEIR